MILQALYQHYQRLREEVDSGIAPPGYSPAKVSHAVLLTENGELTAVWTLENDTGKKKLPKILLVPEQPTRTSGIAAQILCDNASYVLGIARNAQDKDYAAKHADFQSKNVAFLSEIDSPGARAVRRFLETWNAEAALTHPVIISHLDSLREGSNIVFRMAEGSGYIHEEPEIRTAWQTRIGRGDDAEEAQCLVTGEILPAARLHPLIKGVVGAQTSGASLVSFNADAFTSYGKSQSFNAPVSRQAAFAYGTALNYLIASERNRLRMADMTMVFWADKPGARLEEAVLSWSLDPVSPEAGGKEGGRQIDYVAARQAKTVLEEIRQGKLSQDASFDPDVRCYLLGLAPNAARLSVRFWEVSSFGSLLERIGRHYNDMEIAGIERIGGLISPWRALKAVAVQEDSGNIPPLLAGQYVKSILAGQMYPQAIYHLALRRCRTGGEHGGVSTVRAAVIKAFLLRKDDKNKLPKEELISVSLNETHPEPAYHLGRLFSLLEKVQKDALGQLNASIRDRYFGAASATPAAVFPLLLRLARHHIAKSEYGGLSDRKIQQVINRLEGFPRHLSLDEQGYFILGYYHQNQANYVKNEPVNEKEG